MGRCSVIKSIRLGKFWCNKGCGVIENYFRMENRISWSPSLCISLSGAIFESQVSSLSLSVAQMFEGQVPRSLSPSLPLPLSCSLPMLSATRQAQTLAELSLSLSLYTSHSLARVEAKFQGLTLWPDVRKPSSQVQRLVVASGCSGTNAPSVALSVFSSVMPNHS